MERYFTTEEEDRVNVIDHTIEQINKWPNLKIYIGTDSQDKKRVTRYATAIVYRYGTRGAHYIYLLEDVPKIRSMYDRLFKEAQKTIDTALMITQEIPVSIEALEFDYNHVPKWASNKLLSAVKGWALGLNFNPVFKSGQMIAAKAGDHICRHKEPKKDLVV